MNDLLNPELWAAAVLLIGLVYYFYQEKKIERS
jgi:hypothetical protein